MCLDGNILFLFNVSCGFFFFFFAGPKSSVLKSRDIILPTKVCISQGYGLPSGHGGLRTMVLKKTSESPLDSKEIKPVNRKGNQP